MKKSVVGALVLAMMLAMAASAAATPGKGGTPRGPVKGKSVPFACANSANQGNKGKVKQGVHASAGQAICYGQAIGYTSNGQTAGPDLMSSPTGYTPSQIQSAYKLTGISGAGRTVAIVDAYDDPNAESDLALYRSTYGLGACTTANGCFKKVNQSGAASPLPGGDPSWAEEISLDLDAVSATCPSCHIELVEANSANTSDLMAAEKTAEAAHPAAISNSFGESESTSDESGYDSVFNDPGQTIAAATGDSGYGTSWPAVNPHVVAVGGTTLSSASNARGWTETAWSGAGAGCSLEPKPTWQTDSGCAKRTIADVAADADPNTGLGIYDTYNSCGSNVVCDLLIELGLVPGADGWVQVGGTSMSTPIIASVYALAGGGTNDASQPYADPSGLYDVTSGSDGSCSTSYLCTARTGYDGPTGLGTPDGIGAF